MKLFRHLTGSSNSATQSPAHNVSGATLQPPAKFNKLTSSLLALVLVGTGIVVVANSRASTVSVPLKPVVDLAAAGVIGIANNANVTTSLFQEVDDGTAYTGADNAATQVQTVSGKNVTGSHTTGYSGAPAGTITQVATHVRAMRSSNTKGSMQLKLYNGSTLIGTSPVHSLGNNWANYDDTFSGLTVTDGNAIRTQVILNNTTAKGNVSYTMVWIDETSNQPVDQPPTVAITTPANNAAVTGVVNVTGTSADDVSVSKVEVQVDGGPYQAVIGTTSWNYSWDTAGLTGAHTLAARVTDSVGQANTSQISVTAGTTGGGSTNPLAISVSANHLVDGAGNVVQLRGVNRSGTQYACVEGWGFFDGPTDATALSKIKGWGANVVRASLNEDCWLGINGVTPAYSGGLYQQAIKDYVGRLNAQGFRVILDLHWNAPGATLATDQQTMADRDHAPAFWTGVANAFKDNPSVLFDLYNEPHPDSNHNSTAAWTCVKSGGTCPGVSFTAAGSQELTDAIRATGATNVIMVGGPQYAGDVDQWTTYKPSDPLGQLAASIHTYYNTPSSPEWAPCDYLSCWENTVAPLAATTPIVMGELGEHDCSFGLISGTSLSPTQPSLLDWSDQHGISYVAWSWISNGGGNCAAEPSLITNYDGTASGYGAGYRDHLLSLPH
jgi:endoglucanase